MKLKRRLFVSLAPLLFVIPLKADLSHALATSGIKGGLVVHLNCGDGKKTVSLHRNDRYLVHGLEVDAAKVSQARNHARSLGLYGKVSIARFDGQNLPYVDNLVNLIVADGPCSVSADEIMRVLVPLGVAVIDGRKTVKPWPVEIDDWSHHLQGPDNNAVADDTAVDTPRGLKWVCGPLWSRSHEFPSSLNAMVSAEGRLFYIFDEGITSVHTPNIPEGWTLIARDAFNGLLLWKKSLKDWGTRSWKKTSLRGTPATVQRRIVAGDGRLFATLGFAAPVSAIDAATGEVLATYEETANAQELRYINGVLLVRTAGVIAIDTTTGKTLWKVEGKIPQDTVAAGGAKVVYQQGGQIICRGLKDGQELWRVAEQGTVKQVLLHEESVVINGKQVRVLEAVTGKEISTIKGNGQGRRTVFFVIDGQLWIGATGYDLKTGEAKTTIHAEEVNTPGHHPRCYPGKATRNFLITPNRGTEFVSLTGGAHAQNDWTRGPCTFGVLPCNGLLYVGPNPCFCYPGVKVTGLNAFKGIKAPEIEGKRLEKGPAYGNTQAAEAEESGWTTYRGSGARHGAAATSVPVPLKPSWAVRLGGRLTQPVVAGGRVFVAARDAHTIHAIKEDSGGDLWSFVADGRIDSPPTVHRGLLLFGCTDGKVYCLRVSDGELIWRFRAAPSHRMIMAFGQLESPWRVHGSVLVERNVVYLTAGRSTYLDGGILVFGLDPDTGQVLHQTRLDTWARTRTDSVGKPFVPSYHMEGASSDILVSEGGYIYLGQYKLNRSLEIQDVPYILPDPEKKSEAMERTDLMDAPFTQSMGSMQKEEKVQRDWQWRVQKQLMTYYTEKYGGASMGDRKMGRHVFSTSGFLDDEWFNRTFWMYSETWPGFYIAHRAAKTGQLLTVDDHNTYAIQAFPRRNLQSPLFEPATKGYLLFADDNENEPVLPDYTRGVPKGIGFTRKRSPLWFKWVPVRIRAMVATDNALFVAGPPDVVNADDPMGAFEGRKGAVLWAVSKETGEKLSEHKLASPPVFDGMVAANGRLIMSTTEGELICWK